MGWCLFSGRVFVNVQSDAADVQQGVATLQSAASQQQKKCVVFKHFQMPEYQSETESVSSNCLTVPASPNRLACTGQTGPCWSDRLQQENKLNWINQCSHLYVLCNVR